MKNKRILLFAASALLVMTSVTGCGKTEKETTPAQQTTQTAETAPAAAPASAAEILKKTRESMENASSVEGTLALNYVMDYKANGVDGTLEMDVTVDSQMVRASEAVHMKGRVSMNLSGLETETESYVVKEGDEYVTYSCVAGNWTREAAKEKPDTVDAAELLAMLEKAPDQLTGPQAQAENWLVTGNLTGEHLKSVLQTVGGVMDQPDDSYDQLSAAVKILVDQNMDLVSMSLDFTDSYHAYLQNHLEEGGFESITVKNYVLEMSNYQFDQVGEITVPQDVIDTAQAPETESESESETEKPAPGEGGTAQDEHGTYVLGNAWDSNTVHVVTPKGCQYSGASSETVLCFDSSENDSVHTVTLTYTMYTPDETFGAEDIAQMQESSYAYMQTNGDYSLVEFEPVQKVSAAGDTISYTTLTYRYLGTLSCVEYSAWTQLGNGLLVQCTIKEESRDTACDRIGIPDILNTAFSAVSE